MILGLDLGTKRTGLAISAGDYARELTTLATSDHLPERLARLCQEEQIDLLVIGLPQNEDGTASTQTAWVRHQAEKIRVVVQLPTCLENEFLTTVEARRVLTDMGLGSAQIEKRVDQYAAQLILQQYLNHRGVE